MKIVQAQRSRFGDERTENALAARRLADRCAQLLVDAEGHETLELAAGAVDHAERRIPGSRQLGRSRHEALKQRLDRQLGANGHRRVEERAQTILARRDCLHRGKRSEPAENPP
jgi:hypothetical protein